MTSSPQQEYADARAAYDAALARLREAKRHIPQSPRDRFRQRQREKREAERAQYLANKEAIDAAHGEWVNRITAKALAILHQRVNSAERDAEGIGAQIGQSLRIRYPVSYRINDGPPIGNDDE